MFLFAGLGSRQWSVALLEQAVVLELCHSAVPQEILPKFQLLGMCRALEIRLFLAILLAFRSCPQLRSLGASTVIHLLTYTFLLFFQIP